MKRRGFITGMLLSPLALLVKKDAKADPIVIQNSNVEKRWDIATASDIVSWESSVPGTDQTITVFVRTDKSGRILGTCAM